MTNNENKLIHIGKILGHGGKPTLLFLRKKGDSHFAWYEDDENALEKETSVHANTIEEALRLAQKHWKKDSFKTINCGFRYTLPERDEHGNNALFYQMIASFSSINGQYLDDQLGFNCIVHNASQEAKEIWNNLKKQNRL